MKSCKVAALVACLGMSVSAQQPAPKAGILLLAHGGAPQWNERVNAVAASADQSQPTEVAFGMASRASIQSAHESHGAPAAVDHSAHGAPAVDPASPVTTTMKIRMTPALNRHPLIGAIVADRARSISKTPAIEAVILV